MRQVPCDHSYCMLEQTTGLGLPIAATMYNKICSTPECTCTHENTYKQNYPVNESMSSSEKKALIKNLDTVEKSNII